MPAGTIVLTNNSTVVTGTGTSFTSDLKANDFVVAVVGGVSYTLGIKSVDSNTVITLAQAYTGPSASGLAWTPVPFGTMTAITAQLAAQVTYAVRGFNLDKANWQQVYSATGNITVTLPDGSQYSGPSWNAVTGSVTGKMDKNKNLADVDNKSAARSNLGVAYGNVAGTVAQGDDARLNSIDGKGGGNINGNIAASGGVGASTKLWGFVKDVSGATTGNTPQNNMLYGSLNSSQGFGIDIFNSGSDIQARLIVNNSTDVGVLTWGATGSLINGKTGGTYQPVGSDEKLKDNIRDALPGALERICSIQQKEFDWKYNGQAQRGFIAQQLEKVDPLYTFDSGGTKNYNQHALLSDLFGAVQELKHEIDKLKKIF